ncbi:DUF342 domain-containing protein [bacterium]|nr:DUF342 domain-containing protein [bacterium]
MNDDKMNNQSDKDKTDQTNQENESTQEEFTWGDGLKLEVSPDKMSATIEIDALQSENYTANEISDYLTQENLDEELINQKSIQDIFETHNFNRSVPVANGIAPGNGQDGYVDWKVDLSVLEGGNLVEKKGRVDYKEQNRILQVDEDQLLAELIEPTEGEPGKNVYGEDVPPVAGKPAKFPAGKGVRISEDGTELYSTTLGLVCKEGEKISVSPTYTVQGDISFSTGNVDFDESIVVSGEIKTGFKVRAGQDLHVNGLVEGAKIAAGGSIYIDGGIQGDEKADIKAGGDITVKFVNSAKLEANGNIYVNGPITQSNLIAKGKIVLDEKKGVIHGGYTAAEKEIIATVLGSELGVKTQVELGREIAKMKNQIKDNQTKLESLLENYNKLRHATDSLNKLRDSGKITQEQSELRLKIIRSGLQLQAQIKQLKSANKKTEDEIALARKDQRGIGAREMAHPGVAITIMGKKLTIKQPPSKPLFRFIKNEIETFAFKETEDKKADKKKKDKQEDKQEKEETSPESSH